MNLKLSYKNTSSLLFDPKQREPFFRKGVVQTWDEKYPSGLACAVVSSANFHGKKQTAPHAQNSRTVLWADLNDLSTHRQLVQKTFSEANPVADPERQPFFIQTNGILEQSSVEQTDFQGNPINGLKTSVLPFQFSTDKSSSKDGFISVYENKDLYALSENAVKQGYISEQQHKEMNFLIDVIDPTSQNYLFEVGLVNDIKKALVVFLKQVNFQGGAYYYDTDRADRAKPVSDKTIIDKMTQMKAETPSVPVGLFSSARDVDTLYTQHGITDTDNTFNPVHEYHTALSTMGLDFYQNMLHAEGSDLEALTQEFNNRFKQKGFSDDAIAIYKKMLKIPNTDFSNLFSSVFGKTLATDNEPYELNVDRLCTNVFLNREWSDPSHHNQSTYDAFKIPESPTNYYDMVRRKHFGTETDKALFWPHRPQDEHRTWITKPQIP